jgi:hypothetical protein
MDSEWVLPAEDEIPTCIHSHLLRVYGEAIVDMSSTQKWARRVKGAETGWAEFHDKWQSDCPYTTVMPDNICLVDELIRNDLA